MNDHLTNDHLTNDRPTNDHPAQGRPAAPRPAPPASWPRRLGSVLLFAVIAGLGFEVIPVMAALMLKFRIAAPLFDTPEGLPYLRDHIFGTGTWIWLASVPGALGYFFTPPPQRRLLLFAPLYMPLLYGIGAVIWFMARH